MICKIRLFVLVGLFILKCAPSYCDRKNVEYELLQPDGLKGNPSLSIRFFSLNELAPYHYDKEPLEELQKAMANQLKTDLDSLGRFREITVISESEQPKTDLVLEGVFSRVNQGNKAGRILLDSSHPEMRVSGVVNQVASSAAVLWFHCTYEEGESFFLRGGIYLHTVYYSTHDGKELIHKSVGKISKEVAKVINNIEQKHASAKPLTKW